MFKRKSKEKKLMEMVRKHKERGYFALKINEDTINSKKVLKKMKKFKLNAKKKDKLIEEVNKEFKKMLFEFTKKCLEIGDKNKLPINADWKPNIALIIPFSDGSSWDTIFNGETDFDKFVVGRSFHEFAKELLTELGGISSEEMEQETELYKSWRNARNDEENEEPELEYIG